MHLMVDIETLGIELNAVICTVGLALFDPRTNKLFESEECILHWDDQLNRGRTVNPDTLKWWFSQSAEAQKALTKAGSTGIRELWDYFYIKRPSRIWANGPSFDLRLLENLFKSDDLETPWEFWQERDFRTIRDIAKMLNIETEFKGTAHNAKDDAVNQAKLVSLVYQKLQKVE